MSKSISFLTGELVIAIHDYILKHYCGGREGIIQGRNINAALDRIHHHMHYGNLEQNDLLGIAAKYAAAISQGHIFVDGNKRTAFTSMAVFLEINGLHFAFNEDEVVEKLSQLADKKLSESDFEKWLAEILEKKQSDKF